MKIGNFKAAQKYLSQFYGNSSGAYTLERIRHLMDYLGNPQNRLRVIHVAGTSGKTSTAYYIAALLTAAGYKTGLTVSPHVDCLNERLQIAMTPLPEREFCKRLAEFADLVQASGIHPSYFEFMVAMAYWYFDKAGVDYAVVEVGLGGLIDGTNIVDRSDKVCVITDIGYDHMHILGNTLPEIAAQKAGIIQPQNPVFMHRQSSEIMAVVRDRAEAQAAELHVLPVGSVDQATTSLPGFQARNLALAEAATNYVLTERRQQLSSAHIQAAAAIQIPARMEVFTLKDKTVIVDGSHNEQKLATLIESINTRFGIDTPISAVVSFVQAEDSRWQHAVDVLAPRLRHMIITSFYSESDLPKHAVEPAAIQAYCQQKGLQNSSVEADAKRAYQTLLSQPEAVILVTGSFYLLNHIRPLIVKR